MDILKVSTAVTIVMGPMLDSTDGNTPETALTIAQADIRISKNGGAFAQTNNAAGATHMEVGNYSIPLNVTDTGTLGKLRVAVHESGALAVWREFTIVPAMIYDSLVLGTDTVDVNVLTQANIDFGALQKTSLNAATPASVVGAVGSVTGNVGGNVTGTIGSLAAQAKLDVNAEADTALTDYDPPTNTEMVAAFTQIKGATWAATDSLEAIRDKETDIETDTAVIGALGAGLTALSTQASVNAIKAETVLIVADTNELQLNQGNWLTANISSLALEATTIATLASQISFTLTAGSADNDAYNNCTIVIEDVTTATQKAVGIVSDYVGATKTVTLKYDPAIFIMAATDKVYILAENALKATLANRQLNVAADGDIAGNVDGSVGSVVGHTGQTGDNFARIGAAGAGLTALGDTRIANLDATVSSRLAPAGTLAVCTTNTDMRGTDSAALATALATAQADLNILTGTDGATLATAQALYAPNKVVPDAAGTAAGLHTTTNGKIDVIDGIVDAILLDTGTDGVILTTGAIDAILDDVVEGTTTFRQMMKIIYAALAGKSTGGGTATLTFRDIADAKARITATVDANGNRTATTLDGT